jgi:hypothetical protein
VESLQRDACTSWLSFAGGAESPRPDEVGKSGQRTAERFEQSCFVFSLSQLDSSSQQFSGFDPSQSSAPTTSKPSKTRPPSTISHVTPVEVPSRSIPGPKHTVDINRLAERSREARPRPNRSGPGIAILGKRHTARPLVADVPDMPSRAVDDRTQTTPLEHHLRIHGPRSAEVIRPVGHSIAIRRSDGAVVEHVIVRISRRRPARRCLSQHINSVSLHL